MSKLHFVLLSLVTTIAACGGDCSSPNDTHINSVPTPPKVEAPKPVVGFGSGVEKPVVVDTKAKTELPAVEHFIPSTLAECMSLGKGLESKGEHARARELFEAAAKLDRKAAAPQIELARSYIATNDRALAIRHASKGVRLAPESSLAQNTLGRAELLRFNYADAEIAFRQATELDPANVWAWNNLGLAYLAQKNYPDAMTALVEATSHKGTEAYMWNNLGTAYEQLDRLDDARDAFDNGAKLGSVAAKASRKRLEGVDTVAVVTKAKDKKPEKSEPGFDTREPMPDDVDVDVDGPSPEDPAVIVDEKKDAEPPKALEPKAEVPKAEPPKVEDPKPSVTL